MKTELKGMAKKFSQQKVKPNCQQKRIFTRSWLAHSEEPKKWQGLQQSGTAEVLRVGTQLKIARLFEVCIKST